MNPDRPLIPEDRWVSVPPPHPAEPDWAVLVPAASQDGDGRWHASLQDSGGTAVWASPHGLAARLDALAYASRIRDIRSKANYRRPRGTDDVELPERPPGPHEAPVPDDVPEAVLAAAVPGVEAVPGGFRGTLHGARKPWPVHWRCGHVHAALAPGAENCAVARQRQARQTAPGQQRTFTLALPRGARVTTRCTGSGEIEVAVELPEEGGTA